MILHSTCESFVTSSKSLQEWIDLHEQPALRQQDSKGVDCSDESYGQATLGCFDGPQAGEYKVLGMCWRPEDDLFVFDMSSLIQLASTLATYKMQHYLCCRQILRSSRTPVTSRRPFHGVFQKLCSNKTSWDCPLSYELS